MVVLEVIVEALADEILGENVRPEHESDALTYQAVELMETFDLDRKSSTVTRIYLN